MKNCYGRNVFITGASSGIGKACAEIFAKNGCDVVGVSRHVDESITRFEGGGSLTLKRLDITDEAATREFIGNLPGVDIAIMAAGMGIAGPAETTASDLTRKQMEVNYFGTLNAAGPCLTRMRSKGKGLLLVIGSIAGKVSIPMQSQYSASKYALEAFTDAVRMEMRQYGVRACIIEPGDTKTGFTASRVMQNESEDYKAILERSVAKMAKDEQSGRSPGSVAETVLWLAGRRNPPARVAVGLDYKALMLLARLMPDRTKEFILRRMYLPKGK